MEYSELVIRASLGPVSSRTLLLVFVMVNTNMYNCCYEFDYTAKDGISLLKETNGLVFPGLRRPIAGPTGRPNDYVLIRTAGNALQAIPLRSFEQTITKKNIFVAPVPANSCGGDCLVVKNPKDRKMVQVNVPKNFAPGQMLFVEMPIEDAPAAGVTAEKPSHDLELGTYPDSSQCHTQDFVLVQVPEGQAPGSRLQVLLADGRTLMALVPSDPSIHEFYIKVPPTTTGETSTDML